MVFIYPLDTDLYGYFQSIYGYAVVLVPLFGLGIQGAIVKYYPIFVKKEKGSHFLSFTLMLTLTSTLIASLILGVLYYIFRPKLFVLFENFKLIDDHLIYIVGLGYIITFSSLFLYHAVVRYRIVVPDLINTVSLKFFLPVLILSIVFGWVERSWFLYIIICYFVLIGILLFAYVLKLDKHVWKVNIKSIEPTEYKGFGAFMLFSLLNGIGATLALRLDLNMIGAMLSVQAVAVYAIIMNISNVMEIPAKAINQIASPVISSSWANDKQSNIQDVYQKSSLFGLIGGLYLFLLLYFIWVDLLDLMPGKFGMELPTILMIFSLISFARIMDLASGINSVIISYSQQYKYHMYFLIILAVVNIILNYILIGKLGLVGAALSTSISYFLFNVLKYFFVKVRFGFYLSFDRHMYVVLIGIISFSILFILQLDFHPIINIIIKSCITTTVFGLLIYALNPGGEIRNIADEYIHKLAAMSKFKKL